MVAIKQFFVDEEKLKEKMAAKKVAAAAKGPKGKSKFQERLEQMQKAQIQSPIVVLRVLLCRPLFAV